MADQFLGEIRIFAGNFAPTGWALCDGQLLPISQNPGLFQLLGNTYGGDGKTTFALPNLKGSAPMHQGNGGNGLSPRPLGESGGEESVTLVGAQIPAHSHAVQADPNASGQSSPQGNTWGALGRGLGSAYTASSANNVPMSPQALLPAGGSSGVTLAHNNLMPYLCLTFIIALQGEFPPRS